MLKWFLKYVLPGLVIAFVLYLTPLFLGAFNNGILINLLGGVPRSEYDKLVAKVRDIENRPVPPLPPDVIRSKDRIALGTTILHNGNHIVGYVSVVPPIDFAVPTTIHVQPAAQDPGDETFVLVKQGI
jgi:hypothetical protein